MRLFLLSEFGWSPEAEDSRCQTSVGPRGDCENDPDTVNLSFASRLYKNRFTSIFFFKWKIDREAFFGESGVRVLWCIFNLWWGNKAKWVALWETSQRLTVSLSIWGHVVGKWLYLQMVDSKGKRLYEFFWWQSKKKGLLLQQVRLAPKHWLDMDLSEVAGFQLSSEFYIRRPSTMTPTESMEGRCRSLSKWVSE